MQKLKSSEQIEEEILVVRSQISQWWDKCYYGKEQRTLCRPFFDGKLTPLCLGFPDTWIYQPIWYHVWNKSCLHFYTNPIFFSSENLTSSNLTSLKKEETKLRKFYEKNRHIFDNISLQRVYLNYICTWYFLKLFLKTVNNPLKSKFSFIKIWPDQYWILK